MGAIHVGVTIRNPADPSRRWKGRFLVDTGATDSVVPRLQLEAIGLEPGGERTYELADGSLARMDIGVARIEFMGEFVGGTVVFGEDGVEPLLGVTALESMGVEIDPRNQRLKKVAAVRLKGMESWSRKLARKLKENERKLNMTNLRNEGLLEHNRVSLSFSQAYGYEEIPKQLRLEELNEDARIRISNVFQKYLRLFSQQPYSKVCEDLYVYHLNLPLQDWNPHYISNLITTRIVDLDQLNWKHLQPRFNHVFDLVQYVMRHSRCPPGFIGDMRNAFRDGRLAYKIDTSGPPTIVPAATKEEGEAILSALQTLKNHGFSGSATHLRQASECINQGEWSDSIRESIHAVESTARQIAPKASSLSDAIRLLDKQKKFHPALKVAMVKLYGYTCDEPGIRHSLLDDDTARVGMDEAVFMLGACASFSSFLWPKHSDASP